jgi:WD40 repeat protein
VVPRSRILRTAISTDRSLISASVLTYLPDGSTENSVQTWNLSSGELIDQFTMRGWTQALEYSQAAELWAIDFSSGDLTIRDPASNKTRVARAAFGPAVQDLMFSPVENRLAGVSRNQVTLWNTETIRSVLALPLKTFESDFVFSPRVRFSEDGNRLFAHQADGTIRMWDAGE